MDVPWNIGGGKNVFNVLMGSLKTPAGNDFQRRHIRTAKKLTLGVPNDTLGKETFTRMTTLVDNRTHRRRGRPRGSRGHENESADRGGVAEFSGYSVRPTYSPYSNAIMGRCAGHRAGPPGSVDQRTVRMLIHRHSGDRASSQGNWPPRGRSRDKMADRRTQAKAWWRRHWNAGALVAERSGWWLDESSTWVTVDPKIVVDGDKRRRREQVSSRRVPAHRLRPNSIAKHGRGGTR